MFSSLVLGISAGNIISTINAWSVLVGPAHHHLAILFYATRIICFVQFYLTGLEVTVYRILIDKYWKRIPPINETFFNVFLTLWNIGLGGLISAINYFTGESGLVIYRLTGLDIDCFPESKLRLGIQLKLIILVLVVIVIHVGTKTWTRLQHLMKNETPIQSINLNDIANNFNNQVKNNEMINSKSQLILITVGFLLMTPTTLVHFITPLGQSLSNEVATALDLSRQLSGYIIIPLILYVRNAELTQHVKNKIRHFLQLEI